MSETPESNPVLEEAKRLSKEGKKRESERLLTAAIKAHADKQSKDYTELLIFRCFSYFDLARRARTKKAFWMDKAIADYQAAVDILEKHHIWDEHLTGNMTNLGALYYRSNRMEEALRVRQRALEIAETTFDDPTGTRRLVYWNHVAGTLLQLGRIDEAETVIQRAIGIVKADEPELAYILDTYADLREAQAKALRDRAKELQPEDGCQIG